MTPESANPAIAPARVDWTKCDTPIEAPANSNPGPKHFKKWERFIPNTTDGSAFSLRFVLYLKKLHRTQQDS